MFTKFECDIAYKIRYTLILQGKEETNGLFGKYLLSDCRTPGPLLD